MKRTDKPDGGYVLTADTGKDLVVMDGETVTVRAKEVFVPPTGTLNTWTEADELPPEPEKQDDNAAKIAELERQIEELKRNDNK